MPDDEFIDPAADPLVPLVDDDDDELADPLLVKPGVVAPVADDLHDEDTVSLDDLADEEDEVDEDDFDDVDEM